MMDMDRNRLFKPVVYLALFIFFADMLADKFYWYYSVWWFDMPVHFLGGFWEGIFFIWYFSEVRLPFLRRPIRNLNWQTLMQMLIFVFLIGVSWEAGQFLTSNYIGLEPLVVFDAVSDVFFDLLGGVVAIAYVMHKVMPPRLDKLQSS